ncbi:hypothetical protein P5673_032904 [Acropora cervicornis]|uniref:Uncharacterized protein n=1 Tax=Acropora cervicornis TaxID=6130 RepID=A0AAD9PQQ2_ACRCE|nr:hypothetical protein P5673_032904 [Acropora cervicornis]
MSQEGVEETGGKDGPGPEQTDDKDDEENLEREKTLLNLKKEKRIRKTEMTKIRHHMEKLCITPKDSPKDVIEKDIEQLWSLLEITLEILDELCVVYLKNGEEADKQAAMEEGQMLESEIQTAIEKAHEAVKSHAQIFCRDCFAQ